MTTLSKFKSCFLWDFPFEEWNPSQLCITSAHIPSCFRTSDVSSLLESDSEESSFSSSDTDNEEPSLTCRICELVFDNNVTQRLHFQSESHQFKVSAASKNENTSPFNSFQPTFDKDLPNNTSSEDSAAIELFPRPSSPFLTFHFTLVANTQFKMYSHVLWGSKGTPALPSVEIFNLLTQFRSSKVNVIYILYVGGYFFLAEFENDRCLEHTSIKRYVTRRKQGGSQSTHDQKKHARSAGANLRRYNEQALFQDAVQALSSWSTTRFPRAHRVFYYAPSHRKRILHYVPSVSSLCSIPCSVKKPSLKEVHRLHTLLYTLQVTSSIPPTVEDEKAFIPPPLPQASLLENSSEQPSTTENPESLVTETSILKKKKKKKKITTQIALLSHQVETLNVHEIFPSEPPTPSPPPFSPSLQSWLRDTPESKILEREKRALAAERRRGPLPAPPPPLPKTVKTCAQCHQLVRLIPVNRYQQVFCSIPCASQWKKEQPSN